MEALKPKSVINMRAWYVFLYPRKSNAIKVDTCQHSRATNEWKIKTIDQCLKKFIIYNPGAKLLDLIYFDTDENAKLFRDIVDRKFMYDANPFGTRFYSLNFQDVKTFSRKVLGILDFKEGENYIIATPEMIERTQLNVENLINSHYKYDADS